MSLNERLRSERLLLSGWKSTFNLAVKTDQYQTSVISILNIREKEYLFA